MENDQRLGKSPKDCPKIKTRWNGQNYTLFLHGIYWRVRSRRKTGVVDFLIGKGSSAWALREFERIMLEGLKEKRAQPGKHTAQELINCYLDAPKRASETTAKHTVSRFRGVLRAVFRRDPAEILTSEITSKTWSEYMAIQQGGKLDLANKRVENIAINYAVKKAMAIFAKGLRPHYSEAGIVIPTDITDVPLLKTPYLAKAKVQTEDLLTAWERERERNVPMWLAVGIARFSGLRKKEIMAMRPHWLMRRKGVPYIVLQDRPDEGFIHKTDAPPYQAIVLSKELAEAIESLPPDKFVVDPPGSRKEFFDHRILDWLRPYTGSAKMPLHRMRGLYLDQLSIEMEDAILARQQAIQEAAAAAGHTSTSMTVKHYLTPDALR